MARTTTQIIRSVMSRIERADDDLADAREILYLAQEHPDATRSEKDRAAWLVSEIIALRSRCYRVVDMYRSKVAMDEQNDLSKKTT